MNFILTLTDLPVRFHRYIHTLLCILFVCSALNLHAQSNSVASGSFIINTGITPQTFNNGLKPYGMVYDLVVNYNVPVLWSINATKVKDGTDFTYNSTPYKGGPFIIPREYISSAVASRITYWTGQGVQGAYTTSAFSPTIYDTLTSFPILMLDTISGNDQIIADYYANAGIPFTAYKRGAPANLTACYDIWVNPHGDPDWTTHGALRNFVITYKGSVWAECHSVSMMEGCKNPLNAAQQLNFLTSSGLKCYSNNKCDAATENHAGNPSLPGSYYYPSDPLMQFMSTMDGATQGGSEKWFIPVSTGQWNTGTMRLVTTSDGSSPREGVLMAFGYAYGNASNGMVMYQAGHDLNGNGSTPEKVAAQRAYFNYMLVVGGKKKLSINTNVPMSVVRGSSYPVTSTIINGTAPFTYQWSSTLGGTFVNSTLQNTTYSPPNITADTTDVILLKVTDACGRTNFRVKYVALNHYISLPVALTNFHAVPDNENVVANWTTASELNNDYFTLERSSDGAHFEKAGEIDGAGNSHTVLNYTYTDREPLEGTSYYRLKQTDFDHKETYSKIVTVKLTPSKFKIYPNPTQDAVIVDLNDLKNQFVTVEIYTAKGERMMKKVVLVNDDIYQLPIDLSGYTPGIYNIMFSTTNFFQQRTIAIH